MLVTLAFYKGRGGSLFDRVQDRAIRIRTGGPYSHVELVAGQVPRRAVATCYSASGRDGGVRCKVMKLPPTHWDLLLIEARGDPVGFIRDQLGAPYDLRGILFSQAITAGGHDRGRWFCSELVAASIGYAAPHTFSPNALYNSARAFAQ